MEGGDEFDSYFRICCGYVGAKSVGPDPVNLGPLGLEVPPKLSELCKHCHQVRKRHMDDGKCLFEATHFTALWPDEEWYRRYVEACTLKIEKKEKTRAAYLALPWYKRLWLNVVIFFKTF